MDAIADFLTRLRNAMQAKKRVVRIPYSRLKTDITKILLDSGYITNYKVEFDKEKTTFPQGTLMIALKYAPETGRPAIKELGRISKQSLRKYAGADELPRIINGLGISIISTSKGVMSDKQARREHVGGEVLCYVY